MGTFVNVSYVNCVLNIIYADLHLTTAFFSNMAKPTTIHIYVPMQAKYTSKLVCEYVCSESTLHSSQY